jgi:predicted acylesterase/phospholipase RssA
MSIDTTDETFTALRAACSVPQHLPPQRLDTAYHCIDSGTLRLYPLDRHDEGVTIGFGLGGSPYEAHREGHHRHAALNKRLNACALRRRVR